MEGAEGGHGPTARGLAHALRARRRTLEECQQLGAAEGHSEDHRDVQGGRSRPQELPERAVEASPRGRGAEGPAQEGLHEEMISSQSATPAELRSKFT